MFLDVDRSQQVLGNHALGQDDGVLVVQAFPRHVGDQEVLPQCHFSAVSGGTVGDNVSDFQALVQVHHDLLVIAVALVGTLELFDAVDVGLSGVVVHLDDVGADFGNHTGGLRHHHVTGVNRGAFFDAGTHQR